MVRFRRVWAAVAAMLAVSAVTAGCGGGDDDSSTGGNGTGDVPSLTVYTGSANVLNAQQWVAEGAGLFEKHGVTVKLGNPNAGPQGAAALIAGQTDVLLTGMGSAMAAIKQGHTIKMIYGVSDFDWRAHSLAARQGIKSIDELKALGSKCKVAGAAPGTGTYGAQVYALKALGLNCKVQQFTMLPDILTSVVSGQADFGMVPPSLAATAGDKVSILFDPTKATEAEGQRLFPIDVVATGVFVTEDTIKNKGESIRRYLAALSEAYGLIQSESPDKLAAQTIKVKDAFGTVDPKALAAQYVSLKPVFRDGDVSEAEWKAFLTAFGVDFKAPSVDPTSPAQSYSALVDMGPLKDSRK